MKKLDGTRRAFGSALGAAALLGLVPLAMAQDFPSRSKPIRIVVGFTAGGGTDAQARIVAQKLGEVLGTSVIVDNRPGASTMLAANEVSRALPDGYTLLYAPSSTMAQNPHTFAQVPYDPFKDFTAISMGGRGPLVLSVSTSVPANNVKELVAYVKANPGKVSYASFGAGTSSHIYGEAFVKKTGVDAVHIPYKGGSDAAKDLIGGRVQYMFDSASSAVITSASGKVKILAIAANARIRRCPTCPPSPSRASPGSTCRVGSVSTGRRTCRRQSSPSSTRRSRRCWLCRRCASSIARAATKPVRRRRKNSPASRARPTSAGARWCSR
jgi:tripartite-type tricarboxylate transporter receptor subunit TctC